MQGLDAQHLRELFLVEAREHLDALAAGLLGLQTGTVEEGELDRLFRAAHSVKGGAGACDLPHVVRLTHALEGLLDDLRSGRRAPDEDVVAVLLRACDHVAALLDIAEQGDASAPAWLDEAIATVRRVREQGSTDAGAPRSGPREDWRVCITPHPDILQLCNDPLPVFELLADEGLALVKCDLSAVPPLAELDPLSLFLQWTLELRSGPPRAELDDIIGLIEDEAKLCVEALPSKAPAERPDTGARRAAGARPSRGQRSIRVDTQRIDDLLDEVGELVTAHAVVAERAQAAVAEDPVLAEALKSLQRRVRTLQDGVLSMRMRPIRDLFERVPRLVFELGRDLGKKARVQMEGEWTEVDREVLEKLADPMVHLVRNALDHGLEVPEVRLAAGKPEMGTLTLGASHAGGDVVITIVDDGGGIDPGRVLARARERGVVPANAVLADDEAVGLIFQPGFSTAEEVTDVSGRGVGMDVVRQNIEALGGRVGVTSRLGEGTTFRITLPLTLAILDGQLLEAGGLRYVLPVRAMVECLRPERRHFHRVQGRGTVYLLRGEALPVLDLARAFGTEPTTDDPLLVVAEAAGTRTALLVDRLQTQRQFVIKGLDRHHRPVPGLVGATVLTDGSLAMVLDAATLCGSSESELARRARGVELVDLVDEDALDDRRLVTFACGDSTFAVPGRRVVEIRQWRTATPVPFAEPALLGVIAVGGEVLPVLDGRRCLGQPAADGSRPVVMILEIRGEERVRRLGLRVDRVLEVRTWFASDLVPAEAPGVVAGVLPDGEDVVAVIDVARLGRRP